MPIMLAVPVWCEYEDGFREPEGDIIVSRYPIVGDELVLCDKKTWVVTDIEGDPRTCWPKVICRIKPELEKEKENDNRPVKQCT